MARGSDIAKIALCAGFGTCLLMCASDMANVLLLPDALRSAQQRLPRAEDYMVFLFVGCALGMAGSIAYLFRAWSRVLAISIIVMASIVCLYVVLGWPPGYAGFVRSLRPASVGISVLSALGVAMIVVPANQATARNLIRRSA